MKKVVLSVAFILVFVAYVLRSKISSSDQMAPTPTSITLVTPSITSESTSVPTISLPSPTNSPVPTSKPLGKYKDGRYTGPVTDAYYGNVEIALTISGGKIVSVDFLQYPNDRRTSSEINSVATKILSSEAIQAQSANVDIVSGATQTSRAFIDSLDSALNSAKNV